MFEISGELNMEMLRFGKAKSNSSLRSIIRQADAWKQVARDLRAIADRRALPELDPDNTPVIDQWFVEKYTVPMLIGYVSYPDDREPDHGRYAWMNFTAPLVLFSHRGGMARSAERWYRLGCPSLIAEDTIGRWSTKGEF
jgi:hypothetical protein